MPLFYFIFKQSRTIYIFIIFFEQRGSKGFFFQLILILRCLLDLREGFFCFFFKTLVSLEEEIRVVFFTITFSVSISSAVVNMLVERPPSIEPGEHLRRLDVAARGCETVLVAGGWAWFPCFGGT